MGSIGNGACMRVWTADMMVGDMITVLDIGGGVSWG